MSASLVLKKFLRECPVCGCTPPSLRGLISTLPRNVRGLSTLPPRRVVVVGKTTRLDYERRRNQLTTEDALRNRLSEFGSDYETLLQRHSQQTRHLDIITNFLESQGVSMRLRDRESYSAEDVEWAESVFSAGGDGNFLWAASKVVSPDKLLVGLNTDPTSSEGYLCLDSSRHGSLQNALGAVFRGEVPRYRRARIRVEVDGDSLPVPALNEVFIGERNPAHASYYEFSRDGSDGDKQKSSGLLIYSGTGSTSWAYNANKMTRGEVSRVLELAREKGWGGDTVSSELLSKVTEKYNSSNVFPGHEMSMGFVVREPIVRGILPARHTHGRAVSISVRSLSWNTELVVDGQFHYDLKRGGVVKCWLHPQDMLLTLCNTQQQNHL